MGFYEVISTSASHIYHSALPLSPKKSIVWELYEQYAHPLVRIVQGAPMSWDPAIATVKPLGGLCNPVWSPCNRFIAFPSLRGQEVHILDAVTLKQLKLFEYPGNYPRLVAFSPDSHMLACLGSGTGHLVCWDVQTGVPVCKIPIGVGSVEEPSSFTYSVSGTTLGVLFYCFEPYPIKHSINIYNILSGMLVFCHQIGEVAVPTIWTHGGSIQFAVLNVQSICIWEVGFTSKNPPIKVNSLPTPDTLDPWGKLIFHPTPPRLAFNLDKTLLVWDTHCSKLLLNCVDFWKRHTATFSPGGCLFACATLTGEIYLWEESPTGYILCQKFMPSIQPHGILCPNRQSLVAYNISTLQLFHIAGSTTFPPGVHTQPVGDTDHFILEFSLYGSLAVAARSRDTTATILNFKSGATLLDIDTGISVYGLGITRSTVAVVGDNKVITWNLPAGNCIPNTRVNINDSIQTTPLQCSGHYKLGLASISPDFSKVVAVTWSPKTDDMAPQRIGVRIHDMSTGKLLAGSQTRFSLACFTSDGNEIWCCTKGHEGGLAIIKDIRSDVTELNNLDGSGVPSGGLPWRSSNSYQVMDDGWILGSGGKHLFWLPHHWQSHKEYRVWCGQFLALVHHTLPNIVILELLQE